MTASLATLSRRLAPALSLVLGGLAAATALAQDVELYDQPRFAGMRLTLSGDAADLASYGIGNRVASVVVKSGRWEFCTQPQYRGACVTVGPGRYAEMPPALRGTLASVRPTGEGAANAAAGRWPAPQATSADAVALYENPDFTGNRLGLSEADSRLSNRAFNDVATAVEITRGRWQLCEHADFAGECTVFGPGRHVLGGRLRNAVSSLRPVAGSGADARPLSARGGIVLYEHGDFQGREQLVREPVANLGTLNFNDRVSSVEVLGGRWELCTDAEYGGRCVMLGVGRHNLERSLNDRISSVRPR